MLSPPTLWRQWLAQRGVPGALDRLLAHHRADKPTWAALTAAARWAPLIVEALGGRAGPSGEILLDQLRQLSAEDVLLAGASCEGRPVAPRIADRLARARKALQKRGDLPSQLVLHGIPSGFAPALARRAELGWALGPWLAAQTRPAPLWVRAADETAAADLRAEGYAVHPDGPSLRVEGPRGITTSAVYQAGRIEGMDLSSQRCAEKAMPWPGARVWDLCAGRGGKTLVLARGLDGRGSLQATDTDPEKLATLKIRLRRAGLADQVRIHPWDGEAVPTFGPETRGGFDIVLVDAPCSSSGTWRRNPDAKLRVAPDLAPYRELQERLVRVALGALRPRGKVVYVTCSFAVEEDEDVAQGSGATVVEQGLVGPPELDGDTMFYAVLSPA